MPTVRVVNFLYLPYRWWVGWTRFPEMWHGYLRTCKKYQNWINQCQWFHQSRFRRLTTETFNYFSILDLLDSRNCRSRSNCKVGCFLPEHVNYYKPCNTIAFVHTIPIMPRTSKRMKVLEQLDAVFKTRMVARAIRIFDSDSDSFEDTVDEAVGLSLASAQRRRYFFVFAFQSTKMGHPITFSKMILMRQG